MNNYQVVCNKPRIMWLSQKFIDTILDSSGYSPVFIKNKNSVLSCGLKIVKLKEIIKGTLTTGSTPEYSEHPIPNGAVLLKTVNIGSNDLMNSKLFYIDNNVHENKLKGSKLKIGEIVITVIGATDDVIGRAVVYSNYPERANITQSLCKFSIKDNYDKHYISSFINSKYGHSLILQRAASSTRRYINNSDLGDILIPIPSLEIQKYIGDKVRHAELLKERAFVIEEKLDRLFKSLFNLSINLSNIWWLNQNYLIDRLDCEYNYKYFYELKEQFISRKFKVVNFEDLIKKKMSEPQTESKEFVKDGIPILRITDIHEDYLDFINCAKIPEHIYEDLRDFQLVPNDILFGLSGTVGRAIVVPEEIPQKAITNRRIAKITLENPMLAYYIAYFLNSEYGYIQLQRETTGGVQKNLRLEDVGRIFIPLPEESIISSFTEMIREKTNLLRKSKNLIQTAKQDVEALIEGTFDTFNLKQQPEIR